MTEPSPSSAPPTPPSQRDGCLQALAILVGTVLLLPGVCGIILAGLDPHEMLVDPTWLLFVVSMLAIGAGGIALIRWAVRRPRQ